MSNRYPLSVHRSNLLVKTIDCIINMFNKVIVITASVSDGEYRRPIIDLSDSFTSHTYRMTMILIEYQQQSLVKQKEKSNCFLAQ